MIKLIKQNMWLFIPLVLSLLYFLRMAFVYSLLGSYETSSIVLIFLLLLIVPIHHNKKIFLLISRIWGILIAIWAGVRIIISILNYFTNTFDEYHLTYQFGVNRIGISLIMLFFGVLIIRHSNSKRFRHAQTQDV